MRVRKLTRLRKGGGEVNFKGRVARTESERYFGIAIRRMWISVIDKKKLNWARIA